MEANINSKICGFYKLEAVNVNTGKKRILADWFPNLITNAGLNRIATNSDFLNYCQVGSGTRTPSITDIGLVAIIAGSGTLQSYSDTINSTSPYYTSIIRTYRFTAGTATGNISEVGVGWGASGNTLFSRALILDSESNPTTITVLSDEYLDVTYEYRFYPKETDTTGTVLFTGNKGTSFDYILRPANIDSIVRVYGFSNNRYTVPMNNTDQQYYSSDASFTAYDGSIGIITDYPSGTSSTINWPAGVVGSYVAGSYTLTLTITAGPNDWILTNGIKSITFPFGPCWYQIEFNNAILKTDQDIVSLTFSHTWGRL